MLTAKEFEEQCRSDVEHQLRNEMQVTLHNLEDEKRELQHKVKELEFDLRYLLADRDAIIRTLGVVLGQQMASEMPDGKVRP